MNGKDPSSLPPFKSDDEAFNYMAYVITHPDATYGKDFLNNAIMKCEPQGLNKIKTTTLLKFCHSNFEKVLNCRNQRKSYPTYTDIIVNNLKDEVLLSLRFQNNQTNILRPSASYADTVTATITPPSCRPM